MKPLEVDLLPLQKLNIKFYKAWPSNSKKKEDINGRRTPHDGRRGAPTHRNR